MSKEVMKQALEAQEHMKLSRDYARLPGYPLSDADRQMEKSTAALREALAEQPAQRTWVGLTDDEIDDIFKLNHRRLGGWDYNGDDVMYDEHFESAVAAIEAKLKEKNT